MEKSQSLSETFKSLFKSKKNADITFVVHGRELQAHKLILSSRSVVFDAMFSSNFKTENGKYLIEDPEITFEDFVNFLQFLYTDNCVINEANIATLLHLSNFYAVGFLAEKCVERIEKQLDSCNIFMYAEIGLLYSKTCPLLDICLKKLPKYLPLNSLNHRTNGGYQPISPELALKIIQKCPRDEDLTEERLFTILFYWIKNNINRADPQETIKNAFKPFMPYIKFENLEPQTLTTKVRDYKLLDDSVLVDALSKAVQYPYAKKYNYDENETLFPRFVQFFRFFSNAFFAAFYH